MKSFLVAIASVASLAAVAKSPTDEPAMPKSEDQMHAQLRVSNPIQRTPAAAKRNRTSKNNVQGLKPSDRRYRIFD
jgi:hypothetical protein